MTTQSSNDRWGVLLPVFAALVLAALWVIPQVGRGSNSLVVYCAHDAVFADEILKAFEQQTGIHVDIRYDTEATKSLGLINLIQQERRQPRCDVFWNNEMLGTVELKTQELLEPYRGSGWQRIPEKYRDDQGHWVGFGARMRVVIVNTREFSARIPRIPLPGEPSIPSGVDDRPQMLVDEAMLQNIVTMETSRVAAAKPMFGTTLTHYTVLWDAWGPEQLKAWHHELRSRGMREVSGNGPVKDVVAGGICEVGLTDTDDVFVAIDENLPVDMFPVRLAPLRAHDEPVSAISAIPVDAPLLTISYVPATPDSRLWQKGSDPLRAGDFQGESIALQRVRPLLPQAPDRARGATICIPNTAAIIRGTRHLEAARQLVDYLASAEVELKLARSKSRQIPLGPVDDEELPADVRRLKAWAADGVDLRHLLPARRECLDWLKSEYLN